MTMRVQKYFEKTKKNACHIFETSVITAPNLTKPMEKRMIKDLFAPLRARRLAIAASIAIPFAMTVSAFAQQPAASPGTQLPENGPGPAAPPAPAAAGEATTERVVVTGSYIPTAEEVTASPLDTLTTQEIRSFRQLGNS